jgi:hypothetical protein
MSDPATILRAFADLAPAGSRVSYDVLRDGEPFLWLGTKDGPLVVQLGESEGDVGRRREPADVATLERLAALDALHANERLVREGWVFLCGRATIDDQARQLCLPLVSVPVRVHAPPESPSVVRAGDRELLPLVSDMSRALELENTMEFGGGALGPALENEEASQGLIDRLPRLQRWIHEVVGAAGLGPVTIVAPTQHPSHYRMSDELYAVVGSALYLARDPNSADLSSSLLNWAAIGGLDATGFAAMYAAEPPAAVVPTDEQVRSPRPLSRAQRAVVVSSRVAPVTVVSGPPGSGKTHTLAAVAIDAVARGQSVLIATMSDHAADALTDLLRREPGPVPVLFGNAEQRQAVATQLAAGLGTPRPEAELRRLAEGVRAASRRVDQLEAIIGERLWRELLAGDAVRFEGVELALRAAVPGPFEPDTDLDRISELVAASAGPPRGWIERWRTRRRRRRLTRLLGTTADVSEPTIRDAVAVARARLDAATLELQGGTVLDPLWNELRQVDAALAAAAGSYVDELSRSLSGASGEGRKAVAALATALRAGRARRRMHLERVDGQALVRALPLWVGTLRDIDDLLPARPGMFDLVILDEASQIDQVRAAPALLRGRRAVVSGDPYQLRHVTFLADDDVTNVLGRRGLTPMADRLDLRRNSIFDASLAVAAVNWLDQHYRSVPHLIEFSADHFYRDRIALMTRHPRNEQLDAIDVVRVVGERGEDGVNRAEVDAAARIVHELADAGVTSIGVVSPFRAQADALEAMLVREFSSGDIRRMGLRVGTVHTFQGNERDVVVMSLALSDSDGGTSRRFLEDPNLFNVLVTRARRKAIVITAVQDPVDGLLADYLRYADHPPGPPGEGVHASEWSQRLGEELARNGAVVRAGYPVGSWLVDLCLGDGEEAAALECCVHGAGIAFHIDRHRELDRAGWRIAGAFPTRWESDPVRAALELVGEIGPPAG